jgi:hypothetical protein
MQLGRDPWNAHTDTDADTDADAHTRRQTRLEVFLVANKHDHDVGARVCTRLVQPLGHRRERLAAGKGVSMRAKGVSDKETTRNPGQGRRGEERREEEERGGEERREEEEREVAIETHWEMS